MARPFQISVTQRSRLAALVSSGISYSNMAKEFGVCTDTMKRILQREGLAEFDSSKYVEPLKEQTWQRPCLRCKSDDHRPKWQYVCDPCKSNETSATHGVPDTYLGC